MSAENLWRPVRYHRALEGSASYVLEEDLCPSAEDCHDQTTRSNVRRMDQLRGSLRAPWDQITARIIARAFLDRDLDFSNAVLFHHPSKEYCMRGLSC
jgi:hypothetical protein